MQKALLVILSGLILLPVIFTGCNDDDPAPLPPKKIGMVVDAAGYNDNGFNENCRNGLEQAKEDMYLEVDYLVGDNDDLYAAIDSLVRRKENMIFTVGFLLADQTLLAAQNSPSTKFVAIDVEYDTPSDNLLGVVFNSDEVAFLAGYLAAAWADNMMSTDPKVGYVGGMDIPPVNQFIVGYENGVEYYNEKYEKAIPVLGDYANDFADSTQGAAIAAQLFSQGVDVMFGVGGLAGNAAILEAITFDKYCIGTDMDMYYVYPEIEEYILTSCMKKVDTAVYNITSSYIEGQDFNGGGLYIGDLENSGVELSSYHDFFYLIDDTLKQAVNDIKDYIIGDQISTGWQTDTTATVY